MIKKIKLGYKKRPLDLRDYKLGKIQSPVEIPEEFLPDNSWLEQNYQGPTPTCGAHAVSHFKAIQEYQETKTPQRFCPRYSWIKIKMIDGFPLEAGTNLRAMMKSLSSSGICKYSLLGDDITLPLSEYSDPTVITKEMDDNAHPFVISSYAFEDYPTVEKIKQAIFQNKVVFLAITCDDGFWGSEYPTFTTKPYGHFVVADGYTSKYVRIIDSTETKFPVKYIDWKYISFIRELGTAVDVNNSVIPTQNKIIDLLQRVIKLYQLLINKGRYILGQTSYMESNSPKYKLNSIDWKKVGLGAFVAVAGAFLTYITSFITNIDFGPAVTPLVVSGWAIIVNIIRKWLQGEQNSI